MFAPGDSTPTPSRPSTPAGRLEERDVTLASDPKFKRYTQQVDKCLATFESINEWADFISFLTKLLKTFQSFMQFREVPRKLIVSKRLAQCLNPALPSGVHQRALDVYAHILAVLGPDGLARDLQIWSAGLFPFFQYASTSVKPTLLNIYDMHYLPLQSRLRPVMKAFILALLPGLEEETSEFFDKVLSSLDRLSGTVSPAFFLQNLWLVLLTTPSARSAALNYLSRRLPKLRSDDDITPIVGNDLGLMVRAFSASLEDENLLVRRGIMDILVQSLPVDSLALKRCQQEDRVLLMRATVSVVLRRDLSLNRRLYSWLLGPSENSEVQVAYFRENGVSLLVDTLKNEMFSVAPGESKSRPYKIFISLLDKWEIGIPLTERLSLDALRGLKQCLESDEEEDSDVLLTANTLYEAMEPSVVWAQLFHAVVDEFRTETTAFKATDMLLFIMSTFHVRDEEIAQVHLPVFFTSILQLINVSMQWDFLSTRPTAVSLALKLVSSILSEMPRSSLFAWSTPPASEEEVITSGALAQACALYSYNDLPEASTGHPASSPFVSAFQDLLAIAEVCGRALCSSSDLLVADCCGTVLSLLGDLVEALQKEKMDIDWQPTAWFQGLFRSLAQRGTFSLIDRLVTLAVSLGRSGVQPSLSLDSRPNVSVVAAELLRYLEPHCAPYHVRATQLIWAVNSVTSHHHVEAVICHGLTNGSLQRRSASFESLGVLWRLTDDAELPGFRLKAPMLLVLDCLKTEDPHFRRIGETWMRCSLKSYTRALDPILYDLVGPGYSGISTVSTYKGKDVLCYFYERPMDQSRVHYLLESLLSLVRFGGQGFSKSVKTTALARFLQNEKSPLASAKTHGRRTPTTYMDLLLELVLRLLESEPKDALARTMYPMNVKIQSTAIDILQVLVSRGEIDRTTLDLIEKTLVSKLFSSVHTARLDLQNKLLHVLHSVIMARSSTPSPLQHSSKASDAHSVASDSDAAPPSTSASTLEKLHPLLVQTLTDGISKSSNRPVLQHWIDFILMTIPQFVESLHQLVLPLCDCVCRQLRTALADIYRIAVTDVKGKGNLVSATNDSEFVILLNALERLVLISLSRVPDARASEEELNEKSADSGGLFGYVSGVFSADSSVATDEHLSARSPGYRSLHEAVRVLFGIWTMSAWQGSSSEKTADSLTSIYGRMTIRARKVLERLFKAQPTEVLESIIEYWHKDMEPSLGRSVINTCTFDMVDFLTSSAQTLVHMVCEGALSRTAAQADRAKRPAVNPYLSDTTLFNFLEEYYSRLEGPIAIQVWSRSIALAKDVTTNMHAYKQQVFPVLKCMTSLAERVAQTTALEDKRMRREFQDVYVKLVDSCTLIAGRSFEQGNWMRRSQKDILNVEGISRAQSDVSINEKPDSPSNLDSLRSPTTADNVGQIEQYLSKRVLPNLRRFLNDADKVAGVCSNIGYYITTPAIKAKAGSLELSEVTLSLIGEMTKIPSASKAWRLPVGDVFNDAKFFSSKPEAGTKWKPLIRALMDSDKDRLVDVIAKVGMAPSATIFTSRELELLLRCMTIRRLSYVLFSGEKDQFLTQLPSIQEKVVEILRTSNTPAIVHAEVYLFMRVVLCRFSSHSMSTFWPIILTELVRLFESVMLEPPADNSEDLALILAACKFLDMLLVLQMEEFQIHQWMFVTDTVDAIYKPDDWRPESIMDQLAEIIGNLPAAKTRPPNGNDHEPLNPAANHDPRDLYETAPARRPLLDTTSRITSIRDLLPFFSHISISSYESVYASGVVDWEVVERGLMSEMFEGR